MVGQGVSGYCHQVTESPSTDRELQSERERSPLATRRRRWRRRKYRGAKDQDAEESGAQFAIEPLRTETVRGPVCHSGRRRKV